MSDHDALMAAVLDRPEDDTPRLVFADALDDVGEGARAAFVRVQVELARLPACNDLHLYPFAPEDCRACVLRRRERDLWGATDPGGRSYGLVWFPPREIGVATVGITADGPGESHAVVRRGFVDEVRCTLAAWMGGSCPTCAGEGRIGQHHDPSSDTMRGGRRCPGCPEVQGEVVGLAGELCRDHPIATVLAIDAVPVDRERNGVHEHSWATNRTETRVGDFFLPHSIWELLGGGYVWAGGFRVYPNRDTADRALSDALVALGRRLAATPPPGAAPSRAAAP